MLTYGIKINGPASLDIEDANISGVDVALSQSNSTDRTANLRVVDFVANDVKVGIELTGLIKAEARKVSICGRIDHQLVAAIQSSSAQCSPLELAQTYGDRLRSFGIDAYELVKFAVTGSDFVELLIKIINEARVFLN